MGIVSFTQEKHNAAEEKNCLEIIDNVWNDHDHVPYISSLEGVVQKVMALKHWIVSASIETEYLYLYSTSIYWLLVNVSLIFV